MPTEYNPEAFRRIEHARKTNSTLLDLGGLGLRTVPPEVLQLTALTKLKLDVNQLASLPTEIGRLTRLKGLNLSVNQLASLPTEIGRLTDLAELYLSKNRITSLPAEIGGLTKLTVLDISSNQLDSLPAELGQLATLQNLKLDSNHLPETFLAARERGIPALLAYLCSLAEGAQKLYEAKLVLVGEGNVGKSSLVAALRGEPFVENRATTHGIDIKPLIVKGPSFPEEITLKLWDFGGQRVYRVTHQFFFSKRSLYLVVWNPREGEERCDVKGWIRRVKLRVGAEVRILVVATHCGPDERVARIDKDGYRKEFGDMIAGFQEVDSKSGFGIDGLREVIARTVSQLPQMGEPFNYKWKAARDEVSALTQPQIPLTVFAELCRKHDLDEMATRTLAELMNDLGQIVYFDDESLKDLVILRPEWLTKVISYVLEDKPTNQAAGVLEHARLRAIWYEHSNPNYEHYDPQLHPFFLRLMEKFDVSYRMPEGDKSLVGQLVPTAPAHRPWASTDSPPDGQSQLVLACAMDEDPPGLVPWLIVRSHRFSTCNHWQQGVFLEDKDYGAALLELLDRELLITVRGAYPARFRDILSDLVTFLIQQRWPGMVYRLCVPCPESLAGKPCAGRFALRFLEERKRRGDQKTSCQRCYNDVAIDRLLLGFAPAAFDFQKEFERLHGSFAELHGRLDEAAVERAQIAGEADQRFRKLLINLSTETRDCPRLFTLLPEDVNQWNPLNWFKATYRLTLWCEMPTCVHSTDLLGDGTGHYRIVSTDDWAVKLVRLASYGATVVNALRILVPFIRPVPTIGLDEKHLKEAADKLELMSKVTATLLKDEQKVGLSIQWRGIAEGAGLRELHSLLLELDKTQTWGGLRRVVAPTGDFLWLCPAHYRIYEPDLPKL